MFALMAAFWAGEYVVLASLLAATGTVSGMPEKLYASYLGVMQTLADMVQADYDVWSMPSASGCEDLP